MVLSDLAKSGLESDAWVDGYGYQNKDKNITVMKNKSTCMLFFSCSVSKQNHVIPHPVIAAISVLEISQRTHPVRRAKQLEDKNNLSPTILTCPALCYMIHLTYLRILIGSKYKDAMASSEDPDQTAPLRAV